MTVYPTVRLDAPGLTSLVIDHTLGSAGQSLDLGDAVTREVVEDAPDADGTIDTTEHHGARNVTLVVTLTDDADLWALKTRLRAFTRANLRPTLTVQETATAPVVQCTIRRGQWSDPIGTDPRSSGSDQETQRTVTVQWVAPDGILESAALYDQTIAASGGSATAQGIVFPIVFPLNFGAASIVGSATITNNGNAVAYPIIRIYGPCTGPVLTSVTQDASLSFPTLTILAGEFLEIDTRNRTVLYQGDPDDSRYNTFDPATFSWWALEPGDNEITFTPATYDSAANAVVVWRDAYL